MANLSDISTILEDAKRGQYISLKCNKTSSDFDAIVVDESLSRVQSIAAEKWEKGWPYPYDAKVEYLESTGTQYISTFFDPIVNQTKMEIDAQFTDTSFTQRSGRRSGYYTTTGNTRFFISLENGYFEFGYGAKFIGHLLFENAADVERHTFAIDYYNKKLIFDNRTYDASQWEQQVDTGDTPLFCAFQASATEQYNSFCNMRIYGFKWYNGGTLEHYLVPVRKNVNGVDVGYMYDKISGQLFGNAGTGSFIIGPDKA